MSAAVKISIHALRVEGDRECKKSQKRHCISIHALRVEGDPFSDYIILNVCISIHALRVEGDIYQKQIKQTAIGFLSTPSGWRATQTGIVPVSTV